MTHAALSSALFELPAFRERFFAAKATAVRALIGSSSQVNFSAAPIAVDWGYLLNSAALLSQSPKGEHVTAALTIAQACLLDESADEHQKTRAGFLLKALANEPSYSLAEKKGLFSSDAIAKLPPPLRFDAHRIRLEHLVELRSGRNLVCNDFQLQLWDALENDKWVAATAPTSVGKSFLLEQWIAEEVASKTPLKIAYIVPTRALVSQVEQDLRNVLKILGAEGIPILTLPFQVETGMPRAIFVMTQERLLLLDADGSDLSLFTAVIVDEAQKIGDGPRGILLQTALDRIRVGSPEAKFLLLSPYVADNLGELFDIGAGVRPARVVHSEINTVDQYLFWVNQIPGKSKEWQVQWLDAGEARALAKIVLENRPAGVLKRLVFTAFSLSKESAGNVIYVNRAADAEAAGNLIFQLIANGEADKIDDELAALIDVCRTSVHKEFLLGNFLKKGVAFHYGSMPQIIRQEIERLFTSGKIRYLICTSTLIEGVNTSRKRIFMRGPKRGQKNLMTAEDFWNLAGRAGRWGKEFAGEIYCIDTNDLSIWPHGGPPTKRPIVKIESAISKALRKIKELRAYIGAGAPDNFPDRAELEGTFSYLVDDVLSRGEIRLTLRGDVTTAQFLALEQDVVEVSKPLVPIKGVIARNPGVNPLAMMRFLNYLEDRKVQEKPLSDLIPPDPASDDAVKLLTGIFIRISRELGARPLGPAGQSFKAALLVVGWMRGHPLPRLIDDRAKALKVRGKPKKMAAIIREVLRDVDEIARFNAPKYLSCYIDLLRFYFKKEGRSDLIEKIENYGVFLELGVSTQTQISLMKLGMSRTAASLLFEHMVRDDMSVAESVQWLTEQNWRALVPRLVETEIDHVLQTVQKN